MRSVTILLLFSVGAISLAGCSVSTPWPPAMRWNASTRDVGRTLMTLPEPGGTKVAASIVTYVVPSQTAGVVDTAGPFIQDEYGYQISAP